MRGKQLILTFVMLQMYQAEGNGSLKDFNEKKGKEQQKLEKLKVHIQQSLFLHVNVKQIYTCSHPSVHNKTPSLREHFLVPKFDCG